MRTMAMLAMAGLLGACGADRPTPDDATATRKAKAEKADPGSRRTKRERRASVYLRADLDGDGVVTRAEIEREAAGRFARFDGNGDGTVSSDEFAARSDAGRRREPDRARAPFTREEYVSRAVNRFERRDRDDDGRLSGDELSRITRGARSRERPDREAREEPGRGAADAY